MEIFILSFQIILFLNNLGPILPYLKLYLNNLLEVMFQAQPPSFPQVSFHHSYVYSNLYNFVPSASSKVLQIVL